MIRLLCTVFLFIPLLASARKDTVLIDQLDDRLFGTSEIEQVLFGGVRRPINFFYSNEFRYEGRLFTGTAIRKQEGKLTMIMELKNGRVMRFVEAPLHHPLITYSYERKDKDGVLAVDTSRLHLLSGHYWYSRLYSRNDTLRLDKRDTEGRIFNGYYAKSKSKKGHTDDGTSLDPVRDGYQVEIGASRRECTFAHGKQASPWNVYYPDGQLWQIYFEADYHLIDGPFKEFWHNGILKKEGVYVKNEEIGKWIEYDSLGNVHRLNWYSMHPEDNNVIRLDSSLCFYPDGQLYIRFRQNWHSGNYYGDSGTQVVQQVRIHQSEYVYYFRDGRRKELIRNAVRYRDTINATWYSNGQLKSFQLSDHTAKEYYENGMLKSSGLSGYYTARSGDVQEYDSTGKLLLDRTYIDGKVIKVRDSSYGRIDLRRKQIGDSLAGAAVIGLFPVYLQAHYRASQANSTVPGPYWKDSLFIPQGIIDSAAYVVGGVYAAIPDSLHSERAAMFELARLFHPAPDQWIYTLAFHYRDSVGWVNACNAGVILTGDTIADKVLRQLGYSLVSWSVYGNQNKKLEGNLCVVTISVARPINFQRLLKRLNVTGAVITVFCGPPQGEDVRYIYSYKPTFHVQVDYITIAANYSVFGFIGRGDEPNFQALYYVISSDGSVDIKGDQSWLLPRVIEQDRVVPK